MAMLWWGEHRAASIVNEQNRLVVWSTQDSAARSRSRLESALCGRGVGADVLAVGDA
jgi:hypothetical protein